MIKQSAPARRHRFTSRRRTVIEPKTISSEITNQLRKLGRGSRHTDRPSAQPDLGVYTGDLRGVVKDFKARTKAEPAAFVLDLARALLAKKITECRQVAYELIAGHRAARESLNLKTIEELGAGIDNWACVDVFCCHLVGRAWRDGLIKDSAIMRWSRSTDLWWRRAAVVATVPLNSKTHGGTGDAERTLMVCGALAADKEVMVQKAISWALRKLVPWDKKAVVGFLARNEQALSALVLREVSRKVKTGKKN